MEGRGKVAELEEVEEVWAWVEAVADDLTVPPALLRKSSHVWSSSAILSVGGGAWPRSAMIRGEQEAVQTLQKRWVA
jgi:hypothetical protein